MISELTEVFKRYSVDTERVGHIDRAGGNFCSGLFLDYLRRFPSMTLFRTKWILKDSEIFFSQYIIAVNL